MVDNTYITVFTTAPSEDYLFSPLSPPGIEALIESDRLIIRKCVETDFEGYYSLYKQEKPMTWYGLGPHDWDSTKRSFEYIQENSINAGIFLKNSDGSEWELIGEVSGAIRSNLWPAISYLLKEESWG